jgi:protein-disulfide isomerase
LLRRWEAREKMMRYPTAVVVAILVLPSVGVAAERTKKPPEAIGSSTNGGITQAQADTIIDELRSIRRLLEGQRPTAASPGLPAGGMQARMKVPVDTAPAMVLGSEDAPVTLVEYIDFQCPFCKRHQDQVFAQLKERYIDAGKLRYISRNLPLQMHPQAAAAARAAYCAAAQDRYWPMRTALFSDPQHLGDAEITEDAQKTGLDPTAFRACLKDEATAAAVRQEAAEAEKLGISGTPTFVIGKTAKGEIEGALVLGAQPLSAFEARIAELLPGAVAGRQGSSEDARAPKEERRLH